jgi:hypothetical protein
VLSTCIRERDIRGGEETTTTTTAGRKDRWMHRDTK